jgi:uncharacterized protein (DUF2267 family)
LEELTHHGQFADETQAYSALRAVLHALRDRLTTDEAVHLSAQLPMIVRGLYFEGWKPSKTPVKQRHADDFFAAVEISLRNAATTIDPENAVCAVFTLLNDKVTRGEIEDVRNMMPAELKCCWPSNGGLPDRAPRRSEATMREPGQ